MKVVLFEPQIPQNTGNIVRTCSVTGCGLILVEPLGFSTASRHLKRAGLDYWEGVNLMKIDNLDTFLEETSDPFWFFSSKAKVNYTDVSFTSRDLLIFGSETSGLPAHFEQKYSKRFLRLPMQNDKRCLNLATSAGIAVYEAWRQQGFQS